MNFPTIIDYDMVFGNNFSYLLYSDKAEYSFSSSSTEDFTYYTMALFTNSYGFTDERKPQFEIQVISEATSSNLQSQFV
eukprot:CAMPEP_0116875486 /NCGR_PEP_ID=MMETSP0463-20121206/7465_1 /TAXON_ID=181622 /ORGANISM="Strombidinopsis sp, Strain SopsisLIS2011" /LENGTH=78 /DNA_ID=CAMNT_0004521213 /DNA_START=4379 /DNA_END=4615 /DNA_ORIENTATION=+